MHLQAFWTHRLYLVLSFLLSRYLINILFHTPLDCFYECLHFLVSNLIVEGQDRDYSWHYCTSDLILGDSVGTQDSLFLRLFPETDLFVLCRESGGDV